MLHTADRKQEDISHRLLLVQNAFTQRKKKEKKKTEFRGNNFLLGEKDICCPNFQFYGHIRTDLVSKLNQTIRAKGRLNNSTVLVCVSRITFHRPETDKNGRFPDKALSDENSSTKAARIHKKPCSFQAENEKTLIIDIKYNQQAIHFKEILTKSLVCSEIHRIIKRTANYNIPNFQN